MLKTLNILSALMLVTFTVTFAQSVRNSYLPDVDFSRYKTYQWVMIQGRQHPNPSVSAEIQQSIDSQLSTRGLNRTNANADLNIDYQVAVSKTEKWVAYEDRGGSWNDFGLTAAPTKTTVAVGALVLDMYDTAGRRLVWTGAVTKALDPGSTRGMRKKGLDQVATTLLKGFPPK